MVLFDNKKDKHVLEIGDDNHVYANLTLINNTYATVNAILRETRTSPIVDCADDYHCAIVRFDISSQAIPIFYFQDNQYYITLSYSGSNFTQVVTHTSNDLSNPNYKGIFAYDEFLDDINTALDASFTALKSAYPSAPSNTAPSLYYNENTGLFGILTDVGYDVTQSNHIQLWMNDVLYTYFTTFRYLFRGIFNNIDKKDFQIYIYNNGILNKAST